MKDKPINLLIIELIEEQWDSVLEQGGDWYTIYSRLQTDFWYDLTDDIDRMIDHLIDSRISEVWQ